MARKGAFAIICKENKVLLVRRTDIPFWDLPGGGVENIETEMQAAIREVHEETGYIVEIEYKIGEYIRPEKDDTQYIFTAKITGGEAIIKGDETSKLEWFSLKSLPLLMIPHRKKQIKDFMNGSKNIQKTLKEPLINKLFRR